MTPDGVEEQYARDGRQNGSSLARPARIMRRWVRGVVFAAFSQSSFTLRAQRRRE